MTHDDFEFLVHFRFEKCKETLLKKAREYATEDERLANFKRGASLLNTSSAKIAMGYGLKHLISVIDMVEGRLPATEEMFDEKFGDALNYLVLLEACLKDQQNEISIKSGSVNKKVYSYIQDHLKNVKNL
jgi:hypothetical protein